MAGRANDSITYQNILSHVTPSRRAASSMSFGIALKNYIIRNTPIGTAIRGRIKA